MILYTSEASSEASSKFLTGDRRSGDLPKRQTRKNDQTRRSVCSSLSSGESRGRGRRSAVGATEEEAAAFVGGASITQTRRRILNQSRIWVRGRSRRKGEQRRGKRHSYCVVLVKFVKIESTGEVSDCEQQNAADFRDDHGIVSASWASFC